MTRPPEMTARQIAADNRRAYLARLADDIEVAENRAVTDARLAAADRDDPDPGPFDAEARPVGDLDNLTATDPPVPAYTPSAAQRELRSLIDAPASAPTPPPARRFAPTDRPRIVDGIVIPAQSVADSTTATWLLLPIGEVATIGVTARAVGVTPKTGRWLALWIGDDRTERDTVLDEFTAEYATARRARR